MWKWDKATTQKKKIYHEFSNKIIFISFYHIKNTLLRSKWAFSIEKFIFLQTNQSLHTTSRVEMNERILFLFYYEKILNNVTSEWQKDYNFTLFSSYLFIYCWIPLATTTIRLWNAISSQIKSPLTADDYHTNLEKWEFLLFPFRL